MLCGTDPLWSAQCPVGAPADAWSLLMTTTHHSTSDHQLLCQRAMRPCMTDNNTNVAAIAAQLVCSNIWWHLVMGGAALTEVPAGPASSRGHRDSAHSCDEGG